jgi:phosphohistidine phosphatase
MRDFDRPLNERGMNDAPKMASFLQKLDVVPDLIVSSPAKRAITTARFFAAVFRISEDEIVLNPDIYEAEPAEILRIVSELPESSSAAMIFGHNPTFTDIANRFSEDIIENVPTCGVVCIRSGADKWNELFEGNSRIVASWFPKEVL